MDLYLLIASVLAILAIVSTRFAQRFGVPALILFVGLGMLAGSSGPGGIAFDDLGFSLNAGLFCLAIILLSGGLDTPMRLFRASLPPAALLATLGVVVKMLVVGLTAYALTPMSPLEALLLGAVLAPTDAAAVFSVLKGRGLPARLRGVLETESGTNDPMSIYLTVALTALITTGEGSLLRLVPEVAWQLLVGGVLGLVWGRLLVWLINRVKIDAFGLYPILTLAGGILAFSVTNLVGGNGFLAIYLVGLIVANRPIPHRQNIRYFMDGLAWGAQIFMFLLLGLLVFPDRLVDSLPVALVITAALTLVARPLAVYLSLEPLRRLTGHYGFTFREQVVLSWAGLKGAVPIILAIVPLLARVPHSALIFEIVFVVVVLSTAVQGLTIVPLARRLGLTRQEPPEPPLRLELGGVTPPGSGVYDVSLPENAPAVGKRLQELSLPDFALVAAIYRGGELIPPRGQTVLEAGDHVFLIATKAEETGIPLEFVGRTETRAAAPVPAPNIPASDATEGPPERPERPPS